MDSRPSMSSSSFPKVFMYFMAVPSDVKSRFLFLMCYLAGLYGRFYITDKFLYVHYLVSVIVNLSHVISHINAFVCDCPGPNAKNFFLYILHCFTTFIFIQLDGSNMVL